ncbi:MAG: sulfide:quinone oxidoreductase [Pseudonocardiales bacterium]|nr:sulfide:quinone oxidoreductase [Pseudonocardiales bacterium]
MSRFAVVICGGGIAGIEGLLRLRRLAGDDVQVTLVSPDPDLICRPLAVLEPFAMGGARRYPIERIVADTNTRWVADALAWVDRVGRTVHTSGGQELSYDALLLAVGGHEQAAAKGMDVFTARSADQTFRGIVDDIESGAIDRLAFAVPTGPSWPLPLYELALLTARRARDRNVRPDIAFITPEPRPLHAFGGDAGEVVVGLLAEADITLYTGSALHPVGPRHLILRPSGTELRPDRIVTLPRISGPNIRGIPGDAIDRFLAIDAYCRVRDTDGRIFAAGDATNLLVKHGSLSAQQADTAAAAIAHLAGAALEPDPLLPLMRGTLLTGGKPLYLSAQLIAGAGWRAELYDQPPWPLDDKVVAEELGPYLRTMESTSPEH